MFGLYLPRTWSPQSHVQPLRRRSAVLSFSPDRTAFFLPACYDDGRMTKLLEVAGLACHRGGRPVFDGLSFSLAKGELLVLTESGAAALTW